MARVKRGLVAKRRHNKLLGQAKGYRGTKGRLVKMAREAVLHAESYAYHGRKLRKRDIRSLWITRINEALKGMGYSYSKFINNLNTKNIKLDRKILSNLVVEDNETFKQIADKVFTK